MTAEMALLSPAKTEGKSSKECHVPRPVASSLNTYKKKAKTEGKSSKECHAKTMKSKNDL